MHKTSQFLDLKTFFFLGALSLLMLVLGEKLAGAIGVKIAIGFALCWNVAVFCLSERIILSLLSAEPIDDEHMDLYGMVASLAETANLPQPRMYIISHPFPNALSIGSAPEDAAIIVTSGLLSTLNKEELTGVLAHEMAHILHRDTLVSSLAGSVAGLIAKVANTLQWALLLGACDRYQGPTYLSFLGKCVFQMLGPLLGLLIQLATPQNREFAADERAVDLCQEPGALANAIRKIDDAKRRHRFKVVETFPTLAHLFFVNPLPGRLQSLLFATQPANQERVHRLEEIGL